MADPSKDPYKILNVPRTATAAEIKRAYQRLIMKCHPDRVKGGPAEKKRAEDEFKRIQGAYETIGDEKKRRMYDMYGHADGGHAYAGAADSDVFRQFFSEFTSSFGDTFRQSFHCDGDLFGMGMGMPDDVHFQGAFRDGARRSRRSVQEVKMRVTLDELYNGARVKVPVTVRREQTTVNELVVDVRPWYKSGTKFTFAGAGDRIRNGVHKDVVIVMEETRHPFFTRAGDDLQCTLSVSLRDMLRLSKVLYLPGNRTCTVSLRNVRKIGEYVTIAGMGMRRKSGGHGDLKVKVVVDIDVSADVLARLSHGL